MKRNDKRLMTAPGTLPHMIAFALGGLLFAMVAHADGFMYYVASSDYPPVLTLAGSATVNVEPGALYSDAGATATDEEDGTITSRIVVTGTVNTAVIGVYTLTYNVTDSSGNAAQPVVRTVRVVDTLAPAITLTGPSSIRVEAGTSFTDPGATAADSFEGNITAHIAVTGAVNTAVLGTYTLTYNVSDTSGNAAVPVIRTVQVADGIAPVLSLNGATPVTIQAGAAYTDPGALAIDSFQGNITARITVTGNVNTATAGAYTLTYNVTDTSGNAAVPISRTVIVAAPATKPTITMQGDPTVTIESGASYIIPAN